MNYTLINDYCQLPTYFPLFGGGGVIFEVLFLPAPFSNPPPHPLAKKYLKTDSFESMDFVFKLTIWRSLLKYFSLHLAASVTFHLYLHRVQDSPQTTWVNNLTTSRLVVNKVLVWQIMLLPCNFMFFVNWYLLFLIKIRTFQSAS